MDQFNEGNEWMVKREEVLRKLEQQKQIETEMKHISSKQWKATHDD